MMETLAPILVHAREIRRGSGGAGLHRGGDGLTFEFEITPEASSVATSFLMTRLKHPPPGLNGGQPGQRGRLVINGVEVDPTEQRILKPGDRVVMESAGGGGYGKP
jgi:N-methylhydantoinase B